MFFMKNYIDTPFRVKIPECKLVCMKIDLGAVVSVMSEHEFERLLSRGEIEPKTLLPV